MRVLLSDGSGLTARQVATQLAVAGHHVEVLAAGSLALTRFTRHVRRCHRLPPYGPDPLGWLDAAVDVLRRGRFDVLLPTQEQVAVLARFGGRVTELGVGLAVPSFASLRRVQDKLATHATLRELALPEPPTRVVGSPDQLVGIESLPIFVKAPIGTASTGVHYIADRADLRRTAEALAAAGAFDDGGLIVQEPAKGPLVMIQSIFADGELLAGHANLRIREGPGGGASHKRGVDLPEVREHLIRLGRSLEWHGALSLDAVLTPTGPVYIDINPRLVEPGNAWRSGVDLAAMLLRLSLGDTPAPCPPGRPGVATHQLLLAILAAAAHGRRAVLSELAAAIRRSGAYRASHEELTPLRHDPLSAIPILVTASAVLTRPAVRKRFAAGAVANYALTRNGWRQLVRAS
jgi:hypothetical protein